MKSRFFLRWLAAAIWMVFPCPAPLYAGDTGGCHCFQNRHYEPAEKFAADDYIRATALNSMVSKVFAVPKREIIMLRMNGLSAGDMIIGLYLAKQTGVAFDAIRDRRKGGGTWVSILSDSGVVRKLPPVLADRVREKATDGAVRRTVEDLVLESCFPAIFKASTNFRSADENIRDTVLALTFASRYGGSPESYRDAVLKRQKSWGEFAASRGITPQDVGPLVEAAVR